MLACPSCGEANPERARFCLSCGASLSTEGAGERASETRRRVTVLFTDVAGSTTIGEQLDPEALREVMQRYFDAMRVAIERHEGTVEKFIGDAVMAVFGIPQFHEDDALRAVRAAFDMQAALETLNRDIGARWGVQLAIRTGVNTGEVVAGDATAHQTLATGDVVNTAARLEQAAQAGEVLVGPATYRLVRHAVSAEAGQALNLKGKAEPVTPWRVAAVDSTIDAQARRMDSPMVGRDRPLRILTDAAERARDDRTPHLVTVLGLAGVGKSRLVHEFLGRVRGEATVIRGRCLSYGDAITYWPLSEALRPIAGIEPEDSPERAVERLAALADGVPQAKVVAERVGGAIGLVAEGASSGGGQETFWAIRRLFEAMARRRPLVAIFDDVQWGTATFLDLLEHITDWSRDAPILLLAIARPELLEARPTWGGGKMNATTLLLEPLDDASVSQVLNNLVGRQPLPAELARKIEEAAEGNPFFVEELLAMLVDDGILERDGDAYRVTRTPSEIAVPPTIELLLAARLDHLPSEERAVLGRAAVVGKRFGASEVAQISPEPDRGATLQRLLGLVRKELVRLDEGATPDLDELDEEVRFRFRHQLVRDAAYESLPKQERARLHQAFASWMVEALAHRSEELHEVIGYHLEQACLYVRSVGGATAAASRLAERAVDHLAAAAERARTVGDLGAMARLLERAVSLLPAADPRRLGLLPRLAEGLTEIGRLGEAQTAIDEVLSEENVDPAARAAAMEFVELQLQLGRPAGQIEPMVDEALEIRRHLGDAGGIARALFAKGRVHSFRGDLRRQAMALEEALPMAQEAGDVALQAEIMDALASAHGLSRHGGLHHRREVQALLEFARSHGNLLLEAQATKVLGLEAASAGDHDGGLALVARGLAMAADLGSLTSGSSGSMNGSIYEWFGETEAAIAEYQRGIRTLQEIGERGYLSTEASTLALLLLDLDRLEEARDALELAKETGAPDDIVTQVEVQAGEARVLAREGRLVEAEQIARAAAGAADDTDYILLFTYSRIALWDVLRLAGKSEEAGRTLEEAAVAQDRRGNATYAATLRRRSASITTS
jgi:class 3 adenylate cyclase/tetratricopeptide (TPR) repeat protein